MDAEQIDRLSRLWFEALGGICAHVQHGGGGLTPSDLLPAKLTQHQIDELAQRHPVADVLPLTPVQQGLMFHSLFAPGSAEDMYAVQLDITVEGVLDQDRLREAVHTVIGRHPNLAARFYDQHVASFAAKYARDAMDLVGVGPARDEVVWIQS